MSSTILYDVYHGTTDRTLRLATMPGAGYPLTQGAEIGFCRPAGKSPLHSDTAHDVGVRGYRFFQVGEG